MTAGRRGVGLTPMETRRDVIVPSAVLADELGYEIFALPEGLGTGPGPGTDRDRAAHRQDLPRLWHPVGLGAHPGTLAMTAATLHQVCGGRYVLGLGASTKALAEGSTTPRSSTRPPSCATS